MSRSNLILAVFAAVAVLGATMQVNRWQALSQDRAEAERRLRTAQLEAAELANLRAASETRIFGEPPAEDFIERVNLALASIGLPPSAATNITREADRGVAGADPSQRRRDMRIELRPVSPPDLGRFLAAWNADNPAWSVRQLTIRKLTDRRAEPDHYHATLTLSAEYTQTETRGFP